jgi:alkanesulfonate monooxygenase SsuD/methylene tetrahydromethanopterin reductase-like flavin-dependent oxidoreductase (luciferase family)
MTRKPAIGMVAVADRRQASPQDFAQTAAFIHEVSNGRFRFGVGVSHGPTHARMGHESPTAIKLSKPRRRLRHR